jgi:hypothetical protein
MKRRSRDRFFVEIIYLVKFYLFFGRTLNYQDSLFLETIQKKMMDEIIIGIGYWQ